MHTNRYIQRKREVGLKIVPNFRHNCLPRRVISVLQLTNIYNLSLVNIFHVRSRQQEERLMWCLSLRQPCWCRLSETKRAKHPSQVACFSEDLKCWAARDTTCGYKAKDITPSIAWRREAWKEEALDDLPWKDERRSSGVNQTKPFQRRHWGNFWETGWSPYGHFRAHKCHLELNWTESDWTKLRCPACDWIDLISLWYNIHSRLGASYIT